MNKVKVFLGSAMAGALVIPMVAFGAANLTFLTVDGGTNATVEQGSTVEAKVTFDVTTSTDVESMSWELVGSGLPQTCVNTVDRIVDGTFTASFDIDTSGASEGTWDVRIRAYGDDDQDVSNLCEATDQVDSQLFGDRITVTDDVDDNQGNSNDDESGNGSGSTGGSNGNMPSWLAALIAALRPEPATTTPAVSTRCVALNTKLLGTVDNTYNQANVMLQGFLLSEGASIPALTAGASFGFKGPQTNAALAQFRATNQCI